MRADDGAVVFPGSAPSTFTCPLVLGTLNEDGSSKHDKLAAHKNNWAVFLSVKKKKKEEKNQKTIEYICMHPQQNVQKNDFNAVVQQGFSEAFNTFL